VVTVIFLLLNGLDFDAPGDVLAEIVLSSFGVSPDNRGNSVNPPLEQSAVISFTPQDLVNPSYFGDLGQLIRKQY
jgi:hypothetical protein